MATRLSPILDPVSQKPIVVELLDKEIGGAQSIGARRPIDTNLTAGMSPERLASLMLKARQGDPIDFLNFAEEMEERDGQYLSVLGTRKRAVAQLSCKVTPASKGAKDVEIAGHLEKWLKRGRLQAELFDMLDAIGKHVSMTEIVWDKRKLPWMPAKLLYRPPGWFQWNRTDWDTPLLRDESNADGLELQPAKWIVHRHSAKSGIAVRSGLAYCSAWLFLLQLIARANWAAFLDTYGQPIRMGKYPPGTSEDDQWTLMRAVASIGSDAAAIFPQSMTMELLQPAKSDGESFLQFLDYCHQMTSKVVLGQTATTDAIAGGHAVGKEHNEVRGDIRDADAVLLATTLQEQLVDVWVAINFAGVDSPQISLDYEENEDVTVSLDNAMKLADRGVKVSAQEMRDKLKLKTPEDGEETVGAATAAPAAEPEADDAPPTNKPRPKPRLVASNVSRVEIRHALNAASQARRELEVQAELEAALQAAGQPIVDGWVEQLRTALNQATTLEDLGGRLMDLYPELEVDALTTVMGQALALANVSGRDLDA